MWAINYTNALIFGIDPLVFCYKNDIIVNSYKLHFPSSHFSLQLNKKVFHPPTFPLLQPNTHEENQNFFILSIFHPSIIFHHFIFPVL